MKVVAFIIAILIMLFVIRIQYKHTEVAIRNQAEKKQEEAKANFDKMWKVIIQTTQVTESYKDDFYKIYIGISNSRYGDKDPMFTWIQEQNPTLDPSIYRNLQNTIASNRQEFFNIQRELLSIKQEHDNLRKQPVSHFFLGNVPEIEVVIITSDKTDNIYETGNENNVNLR